MGGPAMGFEQFGQGMSYGPPAGIRSGHVLWASDGLWVPAGDASAADDAAGNGATAAHGNGDYDGAASRRLWVRAGAGTTAGIRSGHVLWAGDGLRAIRPGHVVWATDGLRAAASIR